MSDVLSQNEIDDLLKALNNGDVDVEEMKKTKEKMNVLLRIMISSGRRSFPRNTFEPSRSFTTTMVVHFPPACRFTCAKIFR